MPIKTESEMYEDELKAYRIERYITYTINVAELILLVVITVKVW